MIPQLQSWPTPEIFVGNATRVKDWILWENFWDDVGVWVDSDTWND